MITEEPENVGWNEATGEYIIGDLKLVVYIGEIKKIKRLIEIRIDRPVKIRNIQKEKHKIYDG